MKDLNIFSKSLESVQNLTVRHFIWLVFLIISIIFTACSTQATPNPNPNPNPNPENKATINAYANALPTWETPRVQNVDTRDLKEGVVVEDNTTYDCTVETKQLDPNKTTYKDIMLAGLATDVLYPGSLLQGDEIEKGLLRAVRLARSPITITTDLNIDNPSITVDNPTTATMRKAVSELIRRADTRLGEIDVVPGNVFFNRVEAHSYEQSLNEVGISAGYDDKLSTKIDASFNFGSERKASSHTIMVNFVEPLFKISYSEDSIGTPADLFASSVTKADLEQEESQGRMGANNLPVYVKTVTYGRILMYSLTSTEIENFERLSAAVSASYGAFSGGADYTDEDKSILNNSQETLISFGGSQEASKAAILDLNKFFVPIEATQAVPISYEIRDLKGNVASVGDITEYKVQKCNPRAATPIGERIQVTLKEFKINGTCGDGQVEVYGNFNIDGGEVWRISEGNAQGKNSGTFVSINRSSTKDLYYANNDGISISGALFDDDWPSADDKVGTWKFTVTERSGKGDHSSRSNPDCSSTLYYNVKRVSYLY